MRSVLIVSRQVDIAGLVPSLESAGFDVSLAAPAEIAAGRPPEASTCLLDLRDLPPAAFRELHRELTERGTVILALLSSRELGRVTGDLDIDDFILCPPGEGELPLRIERALWRRYGLSSENLVSCGALTLDLANYRVTVDGEPIVLTFKEYELLRFLAMNAGQVFTREQLLNRVWGYDYFGGARTVDVHIRRIRAKIELHGRTFIETVRNVGYRMLTQSR